MLPRSRRRHRACVSKVPRQQSRAILCSKSPGNDLSTAAGKVGSRWIRLRHSVVGVREAPCRRLSDEYRPTSQRAMVKTAGVFCSAG